MTLNGVMTSDVRYLSGS